MPEICKMGLLEIVGALKNREVSVTETVNACLSRIEETESKIEALLCLNSEHALEQAREMDNAGPSPDQPLWGVPIIIKDALSTKDLPTTAASHILEDFMPIYDAFAVRKLKEAGALILAKANMDEFAMGSSTENSAYKKTRNPWNIGRVPGGSSGGSAASVSAHQCFASLGSDTGGSIRQPASFCGCVGLKPTYGRVSRYGLFAFASSMDQIGPLARSVGDCAQMLAVISGHDCRDNTCSTLPVDDYMAAIKSDDLHKPLTDIRIGFPEEFFGEGLDSEVRKGCEMAIKKLQGLGADLIKIKLPDPQVASATYYVLAMAEASSNLARYDGVRYGKRAPGVATIEDLYIKSRSMGFGEEVKRRIMLGSFVLSSGYYDAYFKKAAQVRRLIFEQYQKALKDCDCLVMPVAPVTAWPLGSHADNPLQAYLMDAYTLPANLAGLPGISLPVCLGENTHMPVGIQLIGKHFGEKKLLAISHRLESHLPPLGEPAFKGSL